MPLSSRPRPLAASMVALAILAGVLGVGASASPGATSLTTDAPAGDIPTVVLRMDVGGGFAPFPMSLTNVPPFTLYGDGRVIFRSPDPASGDGPSPPLREAVLDKPASDSLVAMALDRYGLRAAREQYTVDRIADATTTVFTVHADGVDKTVSVYGLGFGDDGPDRRALRHLERLADRLLDPGTWPSPVTAVSDYAPERYRGVFAEDDPEGPDLTPWPWTDLTPADLEPFGDAVAFSQADLTPAQVALVTDVPNGGASGLAIASPDGQAAWRLSVRPMLPDETPLPAAAPASPAASPSATPPPTPVDAEDDDAY